MKRHAASTTRACRRHRRRVPAFGEWNNDDDYGDEHGGNPAVTQHYLLPDSALLQQALFFSSLHKPPAAVVDKLAVKYERQHELVVVGKGNHDYGPLKNRQQQQQQQQQGKKQSHRRVVLADNDQAVCRRAVEKQAVDVDRDLYEIPPDMLCYRGEPSTSRMNKESLTTPRRTSAWWLTGRCCLGGLTSIRVAD